MNRKFSACMKITKNFSWNEKSRRKIKSFYISKIPWWLKYWWKYYCWSLEIITILRFQGKKFLKLKINFFLGWIFYLFVLDLKFIIHIFMAFSCRIHNVLTFCVQLICEHEQHSCTTIRFNVDTWEKKGKSIRPCMGNHWLSSQIYWWEWEIRKIIGFYPILRSSKATTSV